MSTAISRPMAGAPSGARSFVEDFIRALTKRERTFAIVLDAALSIMTGSLAVFLSLRGLLFAAAVCGLVACVWLGLLYRAALGSPRALRPAASRVLAWTLLLSGLAGFTITIFAPGSIAHRLMVLGGSMTFFSAGLVGVRTHRQDSRPADVEHGVLPASGHVENDDAR